MNFGDPSGYAPGTGSMPGSAPGPVGFGPAGDGPVNLGSIGVGTPGSGSVGPGRMGFGIDPAPSAPATPDAPAPRLRPASASARTGSAPVGRASVGRASVGAVGAAGAAPVGGPGTPGAGGAPGVGGGERPTGRVSVGRASVGRASVGRAPVSAPQRPAAPGGPGGPGGSGGRGGPGGSGGRAPRSPRSKKARRRNWIIASIAVVIMIAGATLVGGTYVFANVAAPEDIKLPGESTRIYYADGKTEMAKIGENRTIVPLEKIPVHVQHAVIAAEDRSFYSNDGVDFKGIVRAAWNNVTGGDRQGASTITQQYARKVAELEGEYTRKIKEAAIAMKLADKYSKNDILYRYLNVVYFGRGAYGIEAAAYAYFGKSAEQLTVEEGILLAGVIKNPDAGKGSPFDPTVDPQQATARWESIRDALIEIKPKLVKYGSDKYTVTKDMKIPAVPKFDPKANSAAYGLDKPTGLIVHQVMDELSRLQKTDKNLSKVPDLKNGGLRITTTIDPVAQNAAQKEADRNSKDSPLYGQPQNLTAALVAVEPRTGRVLAYWGGPKGDGCDYAGAPNDPVLGDGENTQVCGKHPPGSTMKVYALAAGLSEGISLNTYWNGKSPAEFPKSGRGKGNPVRNAGGDGSCTGGAEHCTLLESTQKSLNIPFFAMTEKIGAARVLEIARGAGVLQMWDDKGGKHDLNSGKAADFAPKFFSTEIGIGQYPITVLDHATGIASIAARGYYAKAHFVREVFKDNGKGQLDRIYAEQIKPTRVDPKLTEAMTDDIAFALQKVSSDKNWHLDNGRRTATKTGTWQYQQTRDNAHAWTVGYTAGDPKKNYNGMAVAVWVGNVAKEQPIKLNGGKDIAGATTPGPLLRDFLKEATKKHPVGKFPDAKNTGDDSAGNADPPPSAPPTDPNNPGDPPNQGPGNGGPGGGGGGGGDGKPPGLPIFPPPTRPGRP